MCSCKDVEIGSYGNQIELPRPRHMLGRSEGTSSDTICDDECLAEEIKALWSLGIRTTGCCCGHQKVGGYIGVVDADIELMESIGYKAQHNPSRPNDKDSFVPLSQYCSVCQKMICPINIGENMDGEHEGFVYVHDDIEHEDADVCSHKRH